MKYCSCILSRLLRPSIENLCDGENGTGAVGWICRPVWVIIAGRWRLICRADGCGPREK